MRSLILRTATRVLMPLLLLFALFLLLRGHNEPGGGFVGGLVVAAAFVLYAMAYGVDAGRRALLVDPSSLLGAGLLVALGSGVPALVVGRPFFTAMWTRVGIEPTVFLAVIGVVLTIVFTLADVVLTEG
jgi:multicomponent Na+:H+ antiporter subunit B